MAMYHSWDSQNAWLRQIHTENALYVNTATAAAHGIGDGDWAWLESPHGRLRCRVRTMEGVEAATVWTWNAIGKQGGAWGLSATAPEATTGFLLNHLIAEHLPGRAADGGRRLTNSRPGHRAGGVVRRARAPHAGCAHQHEGTSPTFAPLPVTATTPLLRWTLTP